MGSLLTTYGISLHLIYFIRQGINKFHYCIGKANQFLCFFMCWSLTFMNITIKNILECLRPNCYFLRDKTRPLELPNSPGERAFSFNFHAFKLFSAGNLQYAPARDRRHSRDRHHAFKFIISFSHCWAQFVMTGPLYYRFRVNSYNLKLIVKFNPIFVPLLDNQVSPDTIANAVISKNINRYQPIEKSKGIALLWVEFIQPIKASLTTDTAPNQSAEPFCAFLPPNSPKIFSLCYLRCCVQHLLITG